MKKPIALLSGLLCATLAYSQISFTNGSTLFNDATVRSGVAMGIADMNGDGLDDIVRLDNGSDLIVEFQQAGGGQFTKDDDAGNIGGGREWSLCIADVDGDGFNDVMAGGAYNRIKMMNFDAGGFDSIYWVPLPDIFIQGSNFADIDNDGKVDIFACHDDGVSAVWENLGNNGWNYNLGLINAVSTVPSDNSGNYGSVWTDYDSDGDLDLYLSKCRLGVGDPGDGRRLNLLFENDGNNNFTDVAEARGLRPMAQSWSADFGDIDNDGDLDCFLINHDQISRIYENVNNVFTDITAASGINTELGTYSTGIQGLFDDFDNDGFIDIIATGPVNHFVFRNNGDKTFSSVSPFPPGTPRIHTTAIGDLNNDGFLDLITGHGNGYNSPSGSTNDRLLLNSGNSNHWIKAGLTGTTSNINGIGARVEIHGAWGVQVREIRAGEGYSVCNSQEIHFGIGSETSIDSMVIRWPSGIREVICNPEIDRKLLIREGCFAACGGNQYLISADICTGETYLFAGQELSEAGEYDTLLTSSGGCDSTVILTLAVTEIDNSITTDGNVLTAASGYTYQWYNCGKGKQEIDGATEQTYVTDTDGTFSVEVSDGSCSDTSACVTIVGTAVSENHFGFEVVLFPNPSSSLAQVRFGQTVQSASYRLHNVYGAVVLEGSAANVRGLQLEVAILPSGTYLLEMTLDGTSGTLPLIRR